jgi:hypothetical protein
MLARLLTALVAVTLACPTLGCGGDSGSGGGGSSDPAQTPPEGDAAVTKWLDAGDYMKWHCQSAAHASKSPSPHAFNRTCSNDALSGAGSSGDFPEGSANVKELWDKIGGKVIGHAVYKKTAADSAGGSNWYWYEFNPSIDKNKPVADGMGDSGSAKSICVGCHVGAGSSFAKTSRDFVFTQVE